MVQMDELQGRTCRNPEPCAY